MTRNRKKMLALAVCAAMSAGMLPVQGTAAEENKSLPEWVPQSFVDVMHFYNQHGKTYIADGLLCCVQWQNTDGTYSYTTENATGAPEDVADILLHETYLFEAPEKPDASDIDATLAYYEQLEDLGIREYVEFMERVSKDGWSVKDMTVDFCYEVTVYKPKAAGHIDINWRVHNEIYDRPDTVTDLTFEITEDGEITETDIYGWLPDSIMEFYAFRTQNDIASVHDGYIVFCDHIFMDGGYELFWEQNGVGEVKKVRECGYGSIGVLPPPPGSGGETIELYQPATPGAVKLTWKEKREWEDEVVKRTDRYFEIAEDGSICELDEPEMNPGDCNFDGKFNLSDIVILQKWLLGAGELTCWQNADLYPDGKINVFDLCLMKQMLIGG